MYSLYSLKLTAIYPAYLFIFKVKFTSVNDGHEAPRNHIVESDPKTGKTVFDWWDKPDKIDTAVIVQCFPLYSILLAVNRTRIDFLSLDIEGHELKVLQTIPWNKVDIRVI